MGKTWWESAGEGTAESGPSFPLGRRRFGADGGVHFHGPVRRWCPAGIFGGSFASTAQARDPRPPIRFPPGFH